MTTSEKGNIYVAFECRTTPSDWAGIDLAVMKSENGGKSFRRLLLIPGHPTLNNPVLLTDGEMVHFFYCESYRQFFHIQSEDGGAHWSDPDELTKVFSDLPHTVLAGGPGHGVVTPDGTLVVPVWLANNPEDPLSHRPAFVTTLFSRDRGKTWKHGEVLSEENLSGGSETAIALTRDGSVILSIRNRHPEKRFRYWAVSPNGYSCWKYLGLDERFPDPHCMGSLCSEGGRLYFSNCESTTERVNLTVKASDDDFRTFTRIPIAPRAGYSEIACQNGTLYVFFETYEKAGEERVHHRLHLKKVRV